MSQQSNGDTNGKSTQVCAAMVFELADRRGSQLRAQVDVKNYFNDVELNLNQLQAARAIQTGMKF